jgi:hypothetical protein
MPLHVARRVSLSVCLVVLVLLLLPIAAPPTAARGPVSLLVTVVAPATAPVTDLTRRISKFRMAHTRSTSTQPSTRRLRSRLS